MRIIPWDEINGEQGHEQKMEAFLTKETDTFAILQLKEIDETEDLQFRSYAELKRMGIEPDPDHYEIVYTEPLPPFKEQEVFLENCFTRFNVDRPESFRGHSMSVSDIIAIRREGEITAHYVESIGFVELNDFFSGKNYLRTVEDMLEQNDGMIDGIINNLPEDAKPEAHEKKESILEALKEEPAVGVITMKDTGEELRFTDKDTYLAALSGFFDYRPNTVTYKTLTDDPETRKGVDDLVYGLFGEKNPNPIEHYQKLKAERTSKRGCR